MRCSLKVTTLVALGLTCLNALALESQEFCLLPFLDDAALNPGELISTKVWTESGDIALVRSKKFDTKLPYFVFIHNNSGCKEVFVRVFESLHGRANIISVDLPGHGESDDAASPEQTYSFQGYARAVLQALDAIKVDQFIPVGWSLGGHVAMEMMNLYPQRLLGIVTTGSPAMPKRFWAPLLAFNVIRMWWKGVLTMIGQEKRFDENEASFFLEAGGLKEPNTFFVTAAMRTDGKARSLMQESIRSGFGVSDQRALLETSPIPVGIVIGTKDAGVSASYIRSSSRYYRNAKILELDTDHATPWNEPKAFADFLVDFALNNCMVKPLASC